MLFLRAAPTHTLPSRLSLSKQGTAAASQQSVTAIVE